MVAKVLLISLGAAVGANLRYAVTVLASQRWGAGFPWGTLVVNLSGSVIIGLLLALASRTGLPVTWQLLIVTGFLGAYTTFSSFTFETYQLVLDGGWWPAVLNVAGSVGLGLLSVLFGVALARLWS